MDRAVTVPPLRRIAGRLALALATTLCFFALAAVPALAAGDANEASCPAATEESPGFRTYLPDCRAYEMVTPPYKEGYPINVEYVAPTGSSLVGSTLGSLEGSTSSGHPPQGTIYRFTRSASGWVPEQLNASSTEFPEQQFSGGVAAFGTELDSSVWKFVPTLSPVNSGDFFVRHPDGSFTPVGPILPPRTSALSQSTIVGFSSDGTHLLDEFESFGGPTDNWPFDSTFASAKSLLEYSGDPSSTPRLVGVEGGPGSTALVSQCGTYLGAPTNSANPLRAMSQSGETVFFTAVGSDDNECGGTQPPVDQLFARLGQQQTVAVSEPVPNERCTTAECLSAPEADAHFEAGSEDGSKVLFTSTQQLTDGASEGEPLEGSATVGGCSSLEGPNGCNLYLYDFGLPSGRRLITVSAGDTSGEGPQVQGVTAVSPDASHVYFVAKGLLTTVPNQQGRTAIAAEPNLYLFQRDPSHPEGETTFIATLSSSDRADWQAPTARPAATVPQVTPDGRFLVFQSRGRLTDDTTTTAPQLYRYDAQSGELARISIGEYGYGEDGNVATNNAQMAAAGPTLSADGTRVFFTSKAALSPLATSGDSGAFSNVYEYEDGNVHLLTDGRDTDTSGALVQVKLWGVSPSGQDAYFQTTSQLLPQDTDTQEDTYDSRIDGGFPSMPAASPSCVGEACQSAPPAPGEATPGSAALVGSGNQQQQKKNHVKHKKKKHAKRHKKNTGKHRGKHEKNRRHHSGADRGGHR